ncbi:MAG: NAD kinase [Muribaculaceae bacterium]|nr:NAD kinase [Muribaculaceae bacterium]
MRTAIFGNEYQPQHAADIARLLDALLRHKVEVWVEREFSVFLQQAGVSQTAALPTFASQQLPPNAGLVISLGGDGTFLNTVMWVGERELPIVGINTGHLGYLTAYRLDELPDAVPSLLTGDYDLEARIMLEVRCTAAKIDHPFALNDIAILRHDTSAMLELETQLSGVPLTTYKSDGLIVSTPTGSTAYNLSAGGPIIAPQAQCVVLSPISPHSLTMRPLVVPDNAVVTVTTRSRAGNYQVSIDGEVHVCPTTSSVTIRKAPFRAMVVQPRGHDFAATLRQKLHWGG